MTTPSQKPLVYLAADHGGFELKEQAKQWLEEWGYQYQDLGAEELVPEDDYPTYAFAVAEKVSKAYKEDPQTEIKGILFCSSGGGMTIAANKVKRVRAVPVYSVEQAQHARNDNHANIISLAGDWTDAKTAKETMKAFLETPGSTDARHLRRLRDIAAYQA